MGNCGGWSTDNYNGYQVYQQRAAQRIIPVVLLEASVTAAGPPVLAALQPAETPTGQRPMRARAGSFWRASVGCGSPGLARGIAQVPMDGILLPVHNGAECEHWHRSTGAGVVWV